jgi:hypothetical protein
MSDKSEGPGWWIASDGNWYPPELHPSVREAPKPPVPTKMTVPAQPSMATAVSPGAQRWQAHPDQDTHVGPQFPDLFQKALQGSHLVDNVTVMHTMDDGPVSNSFTSPASGGASSVGASSGGGGAKRRWRKSH